MIYYGDKIDSATDVVRDIEFHLLYDWTSEPSNICLTTIKLQ